MAYDSIGKATFEASLDSLRPFGVLASFGAACATGAAVWLLAPLPLHALLANAPRRALPVAAVIAAGAVGAGLIGFAMPHPTNRSDE